MIQLGQKVTFDPFEEMTGFASKDNRGKETVGTVVFVNNRAKWFSVSYQIGSAKQRCSFFFSQIGNEVKLYG